MRDTIGYGAEGSLDGCCKEPNRGWFSASVEEKWVRWPWGSRSMLHSFPSPDLSCLGHREWTTFALLSFRRICSPRESQTPGKARSLVSILESRAGNGRKAKSKLEIRLGKMASGTGRKEFVKTEHLSGNRRWCYQTESMSAMGSCPVSITHSKLVINVTKADV